MDSEYCNCKSWNMYNTHPSSWTVGIKLNLSLQCWLLYSTGEYYIDITPGSMVQTSFLLWNETYSSLLSGRGWLYRTENLVSVQPRTGGTHILPPKQLGLD